MFFCDNSEGDNQGACGIDNVRVYASEGSESFVFSKSLMTSYHKGNVDDADIEIC